MCAWLVTVVCLEAGAGPPPRPRGPPAGRKALPPAGSAHDAPAVLRCISAALQLRPRPRGAALRALTCPSSEADMIRGPALDLGPAPGATSTLVTVFWWLVMRCSIRPPENRSHTHTVGPPAVTSIEPAHARRQRRWSSLPAGACRPAEQSTARADAATWWQSGLAKRAGGEGGGGGRAPEGTNASDSTGWPWLSVRMHLPLRTSHSLHMWSYLHTRGGNTGGRRGQMSRAG